MSLFSSLLGMDASHNQSVYGGIAKQGFQEAGTDRKKAQGGYDTVSANGAADRQTYNQNFPSLYNTFQTLAGISNSGQPGDPNGGPLTGRPQTVGAPPAGTLNAPQGGGPQNSPYALTTPQQAQLNAQTDQYAQQAQAGIDSYRQEAAAKGLPPNPEAEALISQRYSAQAEQGKAAFQENERQQKEQATQTLMQLMMSLGQQGNSEQLQGAEGTAGLGAQAQNAGNSASQISQQYGNQASEIWQGLASLITAGATGGFGGGGAKIGGSSGDTSALQNANTYLPGMGTTGNQFPNYQAGNNPYPAFNFNPSGA